ncbi:MAG: DNA methyltransferase [Acidimicrobiales bacterium MED-G01]|nr:MAG: DNA methyltransferase [Acidimicrobiales bacterium MED-G01]
MGEVLASLEEGDVLSYGEVAEEAGYPRSARAVGRFLQENSGFPWWRIVTADGRLAPGHETRQTELLRREGIEVNDGHITAMRRRTR